MSNPFDQFAADFQAALPAGAPGTAAPAPAPFDAGNPFASGYAPQPSQVPPSPTPPKPVMNAPPPMPSYNGGGGYGMGGPQMGQPTGMYGGMDHGGQQQPQYGMMGGNGM